MESYGVSSVEDNRLNTNVVRKRGAAGVGWRTKAVAYILIAIFSLAVLEILLNVYLRVFRGYDGKHLMSYQFDDYKNIRLTPSYQNTRGIYHNAQGFRRSADTPREKEQGTFRIFIMGGSTAYGLHSLSKYGQAKYSVIKNDETIDYYLEQYLNGKTPYKSVEVINAAITSHQSNHHLIYLNQTILKYNPDMVIFIDGFNDYFSYQKGFDQFRDYAYQERAHRFMGEPTFSALRDYTGWWLFRKSHFIHVAGKSLRPLWLRIRRIGRQRARINVDDALKNLRVNAEANFVKMVERNGLILRHEGILPVFTLQAELVFDQSKVLTEMEQNIFREMSTHWQENYVEFKNKARPIVIDYLAQATAKTGAFFFDLTNIFGRMEEDAYTDYTHLTPMANRWLAEYLGARIVPIIIEGYKKLQLNTQENDKRKLT